MKKNQILCLFAALTILASCKKDDDKINSAGIEGTYTFSAMQAKTNSTITGDDGEKSVSLADWTSANNMGTIVFDSGIVTSSHFSYSVNSKATGYFYQNNILIDSLSLPFAVTIPTTNSVNTYKLIGADSIYFPKGGFVSYGDATTLSNPGGGHYNIKGNQLTLNINGIKDSTFTQSGVKYRVSESVEAKMILIKQ